MKNTEISSNVNVNVKSKRFFNNVNNVNVTKQKQSIAQSLVAKLNDDKSYKYFLFVAWHLPENIIWSICESSLNKQNPSHYFSKACKYQIDERK